MYCERALAQVYINIQLYYWRQKRENKKHMQTNSQTDQLKL